MKVKKIKKNKTFCNHKGTYNCNEKIVRKIIRKLYSEKENNYEFI